MSQRTKPKITKILSEFQCSVFKHPNAKGAFDDLTAALTATVAPQIIILTGPTGVGKSTLARAAQNRLLKQYEEEMRERMDFVPVVAINAVPPNGPSFSWKDFYHRLLTGQNEPLVSRKLFIPKQPSLFFEHQVNPVSFQQSSTDALRRSVEEHLRHRGTRLLIIDEAQHMLLVNNQYRAECQFESLKSLTIETGVTILLVGTYRLLEILGHSGQLTRRSQVVNFPRYDMRNSSDREQFRRVLSHMEQLMSAHIPTTLDDQADYFYEKSVGCVGILKDWLGRCLEYGLQENVAAIDASFAARFALKNYGLINIAEEAFYGEETLADVSDDRLRDLLATGSMLSGIRGGDNNSGSAPASPARGRRPGQRNPMRDPVGQGRLW